MDSSYLHIIALVVAVFFSGIFLRGESARKREFRRELDLLRERQAEINDIVDEINRVSRERDAMLVSQIDSAEAEITRLENDEQLIRADNEALRNEIDQLQQERLALRARIRAVEPLVLRPINRRSAFVDPDIELTDTLAFHPVEADTYYVNTLTAINEGNTITSINQNNTLTRIREGNTLMAPRQGNSYRIPNELKHVRIARTFEGVTEKPVNSNRGPEIEKFLKSVNLEPYRDRDGWHSYPYCAAFVSYCLTEAGTTYPLTRTAGARKFIDRNRSIPARLVQRGTAKIDPGMIVIWKANRNQNDPSGHVGFVIDWQGQAGTTIEGNTSSGKVGSQRDGGGVYVRKRMLSPGSAFRITDFTPVEVN